MAPRDARQLQAVDLAAAPTFQRDVAALHALGALATAEFLAEFALMLDADGRRLMFQRLSAYRGIPQEVLTATGGDRFAPIPLRVVKGYEG